MSYENAPATRLVATHCCCCGRALVDAKSVELGCGPDCRKKHGFDKAEVAPDWKAFFAAVLNHVPLADIGFKFADETAGPEAVTNEVESTWLLGGIETRRVANMVVYRVAALLSSANNTKAFRDVWPVVGALANAVRALGFKKLATIIEERNAVVIIRRVVTPGWGNSHGTFVGGEEFVVEAPYSEEALPILRGVPGRRWDKTKGAKGANVFPSRSVKELFAALVQAYPGARAVGPKGAFILERRAA